MNAHEDMSSNPENQVALPGKQPIQPSGAELVDILATFLEYPPDALILVDGTGSMVLVNTQVEALFGYDRDELISQPVELLLPSHLHAAHATQRAQYMQAPCSRPMGVGLDLVGQRKDGSQFPVDISLRPIWIQHTLHVIAAIRDMTAQREAEREQLQISQRLRQQDKLIGLAHDAILVRDPESHIVSWNEGAEHLYGWTAQEVAGKITHALLQTRFPTSQEAVGHALEQHGQWQGELTHICRDGKQVFVESRQVLMRDEQGAPAAILEINRDVTEQRRLQKVEQEARAELDERLHIFQWVLDRLPNGVFLVHGPRLRLLLANQAAADLWGAVWTRGQPQEEFLRQQAIHLSTSNGQPLPLESLAGWRAMATGEAVFSFQLVIRRPDGTHLPVLVDAIPFEHFPLLSRLVQRLSPVHSSEERVVLMVYQNVSALKEAEALKDQFISLATHELRSPMTIITGYADRLLSSSAQEKGHELDDWQREKVQEMKAAAWQLTTLTEDLLDVTRMQAGQFALEPCATNLRELTQKVIKQFQATTDRRQMLFHSPEIPLWAMVDVCRIEQVLSNLLSNAIKYSPEGGPIEVTLEEQTEPHEARFCIHDQGMGIPRYQQAHLFGRFVRGENVRLAGIRGTGLGLYLCRELVERHGGRISFESDQF